MAKRELRYIKQNKTIETDRILSRKELYEKFGEGRLTLEIAQRKHKYGKPHTSKENAFNKSSRTKIKTRTLYIWERRP